MLVAPVVEKGASSRRVYVPKGRWFDFWTAEALDGGREIDRAVDLETIPLYVRAGAVVPMGPVKQFVDEQVDAPLTLVVYPGADGASTVYEDDGRSFDGYRKGAFMRLHTRWRNAERRLTISLDRNSRMMPPGRRWIEAVMAGQTSGKKIEFRGQTVEVTL
jgi:alpha-glucosidase (family GH31 glycosyl hydrolase)